MVTEYSIFHCRNMNFKARDCLFISDDFCILFYRTTWTLLAELKSNKSVDNKIETVSHHH